MPLGTRYELVGLLLEASGLHVLRVDDGGTWRLDMGLRVTWKARRLTGLRVRVVGVQDNFDLLAVETIERA